MRTKQTHCKRGHEYTGENTYIQPAKSGGHRACKICMAVAKKEWNKNNPEKKKEIQKKAMKVWFAKNPDWYRNNDLRNKYGLTPEQYEQMLKEQAGLCAICGDKMLQINVDHNHQTNKVRQLLCQLCNQGIGSLREDVTILQKAIAYLERH